MSNERWLVRNVLVYPCDRLPGTHKIGVSFMCCYGKMVQIYCWVGNTGYKITYRVSSQFCKKPNHLSTCRLYIYEECIVMTILMYIGINMNAHILYMKDSNNHYLRVMGLWVNPVLKKIFFKGKAVLE